MQNVKFQNRINELSQNLSEQKLAEVIDFVTYLMGKEDTEGLMRTQMASTAYHEWVSTENDIYDEVFADDVE